MQEVSATFPEFRALREYTHALRLVSKLPDLRAGYADRILRACEQSPMRFVRSTSKKSRTPIGVLLFLRRVDKKDAIYFSLSTYIFKE
jgi:hypothetical protein